MKKPKFVTGEEAAAMIKDDSTIATIGMTWFLHLKLFESYRKAFP